MILGFLLGFIACGVLVCVLVAVAYFMLAMIAYNKIECEWIRRYL